MELLETIRDSSSWRQVCKKIYGYEGGHRVKQLKELASDLKIDSSHFVKVVRRKKITKSCPVCGDSFATKDGPKEKTTCSHACSNTYFRKEGDGWDYRKTAFDNYKHECVDCGELRKHTLQVHHIDEDRTNSNLSNLRILCANCHLDTHYKNNSGPFCKRK